MASTVYLQHTVHSVGIPETGHVHVRNSTDPDDETPTAITCEPCEPFLVKNAYAVYSPDLVPLTNRQVAAREKAEREGGTAVRQAAEALAGIMTAKKAEQPPKGRSTKRAGRDGGGRFSTRGSRPAGEVPEVRVVLADPDD